MIRSLRRGPIIVAFILTVAMVALSCGRAFAYMRELQVTTPTAESPAAVKPGGTFLVSGRLQADSGDVLDLEVSIDGIVILPYYEDIAEGEGIGNWVPFEKEVTLPEDESEGLKNLRIRVYVDDPQRPGLSVEAKALLVDDTKPSAPENITVSPSSQSTEKRPTWSWDPSTDPDIEDQDDGTVSGSGVAKYEVRYKKVDSTGWNGPIEVTSGTSWTPAFDFDDGVWEIEVTAIDGAGNRSDTTTGGQYHLDTVGPVFSNAYPEDGLETNEIVFEIEISDGDDGVGVAPESIVWSIAPDVDGQHAWDDATSTSTFTPSGSLAEGIYSLSVTASDKVGNSSAYPVAPTTWSFLVDLTDPECETIGLVDTHRTIDGHVFTNSNTTAITATVIDPGTAPSGFNDTGKVEILVYSDEDMTEGEEVGGTSTPASRPAGNSDSWSVTWTPESALPDATTT